MENDDSNALPDRSELERAVMYALDGAQRRGASSAEAAVNSDVGLGVTVRLGEVETLEHHQSRGMGVTVYFGHRKGSASTSDLSQPAIDAALEAACGIARHTAEDPCAGLAPAERMATQPIDLDLFHPWELDVDAAVDVARACEAAGLRRDERIDNSEGASVSRLAGLTAYGNSHGFLGTTPATRHSLSCALLARNSKGMQRDYWYSVARAPEDLEVAASVGGRAAERVLARLGAGPITTRQAPVLFTPDVARSLIGHFLGAIRGTALYREASFLLNQLGAPVFPEWLTVREEPHLPKGLGSTWFDAEGVATTARDLVRDGCLAGYLLGSYSARRLNMETTGNAGGVHNVIVPPGTEDFDALVARLGDGLVVTELMGQGANLVTGDYSRGAAGFLVENGRLSRPVEEVTIAGNLKDIFAGIQAIGADVDRRSSIHTGSILVDRLTIAGT